MWQEEFKLYKLKDVTKLKNGYAFKSNQFTENEVPIIRINNLQNNKVIIDKKICYPNEFLENNKQYEVKMGDILISMSGSIGKISRYSYTEPSLLNQRVGKFEITEVNKLDREYLFYFLRSDEFQRAVIKDANGCVVSNISAKNISDCSIPVPSLEAQKKIVKVLKKAEDVVEKRKQAINLLDELVKSKFIEMFGNPAINDNGWVIDKLSTVVTNIENGKSFVCESFSRSGKYPAILKLSAVTYGIYNANENKALTDESLYVSSVEVKSEDLLFTRKNTPELVGMSAYVYNTEPNLMMPDLIFRFNTNEKINKIYLWKLINHDLFREKIKSLSNGSAKSMSNISKQRLMELNIPIPPIGLQNQFADFVKQLDKVKFKMEKSLKGLENNFNSLMKDSFSGNLSL